MDLNLGIGEWIVIGFSLLIAAWFVIGGYLNNLRSRKLLDEIVEKVTPLGMVSSSRFLASTSAGFRAMVKFEIGSFSQLEIVMGLLRRENLPLWLFQWLVRKPELLTLNFASRTAPGNELFVFSSQHATGLVEQANRNQSSPLVFREEQNGFRYYSRARSENIDFSPLTRILSAHPSIQILARQSKAPNLTLRIPIRDFLQSSGTDLLNGINDLI